MELMDLVNSKISIRCKMYNFNFLTSPCVLYIVWSFGQRLHPIFRQFVNLIIYNTMQWYSRWNMSNHMLSEEKKHKNWSVLMSSQDIAFVIHCDEQLWRSSFNLLKYFPIKVNDVHIKIQLNSENWVPQKRSKPILYQIGIPVQI